MSPVEGRQHEGASGLAQLVGMWIDCPNSLPSPAVRQLQQAAAVSSQVWTKFAECIIKSLSSSLKYKYITVLSISATCECQYNYVLDINRKELLHRVRVDAQKREKVNNPHVPDTPSHKIPFHFTCGGDSPRKFSWSFTGTSQLGFSVFFFHVWS